MTLMTLLVMTTMRATTVKKGKKTKARYLIVRK
jgi:hypothetical protein